MTIFGSEDFNQGELYLLRHKSEEEFYQVVMLDNLIELCAGIQNAYNVEVFYGNQENRVCFYCSQEQVREELRREITEINLGIKAKISTRITIPYLTQAAKCLQRLIEYTSSSGAGRLRKPGNQGTVPKVIDFCASLSILDTAAEFFKISKLSKEEQKLLRVTNSKRRQEHQFGISIENLTKVPKVIGKQRLIQVVQIRVGLEFAILNSFFYRFALFTNDFFSFPLIKAVTEATYSELPFNEFLIPRYTPFVDRSFVEILDEDFFGLKGGIFASITFLDVEIQRKVKLVGLMSIRHFKDPGGSPHLEPESLTVQRNRLFLTSSDEIAQRIGPGNNTTQLLRGKSFVAREVRLVDKEKGSVPTSVAFKQYDMLTKADGADKILFKQSKELKLCLGECVLLVKKD